MSSITKNPQLSVGILLLKLRTFIALIVLSIIFSIIVPNFFTLGNLIIVTDHAARTAILGIGMTFIILTGGIDLSVGSIAGMVGMLSGGLIFEGLVLKMFGVSIFFNPIVVIIFGLIIGALFGAINGFFITRFNVAPFIATLGMFYIARGIANLRTNGGTFPDLSGKAEFGNLGFPLLGTGKILFIPIPILIMIIIACAAIYIAKKTPLGRHIYAVGGNETAAKLSGIRVKRIKMFAYMAAGLCSAMAGLIASAQLTSSHPATGETWEMSAIAAAVLGGTSLAGGRGTIGGTIIGAFVITVLNDGMVMLGISTFWQMVIRGLVIILAVIVDQTQQKMQERAALQY